MPTPPREFALVPFNHPIRITAQATNAANAAISVQYINLGNAAESGLLQSTGATFDRHMIFDEPHLHELIFIATRGDNQNGATLDLSLTDLVTGTPVVPVGGVPSSTPFQNQVAVLDLIIKNF